MLGAPRRGCLPSLSLGFFVREMGLMTHLLSRLWGDWRRAALMRFLCVATSASVTRCTDACSCGTLGAGSRGHQPAPLGHRCAGPAASAPSAARHPDGGLRFARLPRGTAQGTCGTGRSGSCFVHKFSESPGAPEFRENKCIRGHALFLCAAHGFPCKIRHFFIFFYFLNVLFYCC